MGVDPPEGSDGREVRGGGHDGECGGGEEELGKAQGEAGGSAGHAREVLHSDAGRVWTGGAVCGGHIVNWVNRPMAHIHLVSPQLIIQES